MPLLLITLLALVLIPSTSTANEAPAERQSVTILALDCAADPKWDPRLDVRTSHREVALSATDWRNVGAGTYATTLALKPGTYSIHVSNKDGCSSEESRTVLLAGHSRHILLPLSLPKGQLRLDDTSFTAIAGRLPTAGLALDLVPLGNYFTNTTRLTATIDGDAYYLEGIHAGRYLLRIHVGRHILELPLTVQSRVTTERDVTLEDLRKTAEGEPDTKGDSYDRNFYFDLQGAGARMISLAIEAARSAGYLADRSVLDTYAMTVRESWDQVNVDFCRNRQGCAFTFKCERPARGKEPAGIWVVVPKATSKPEIIEACS